jgi:hypothetical protein
MYETVPTPKQWGQLKELTLTENRHVFTQKVTEVPHIDFSWKEITVSGQTDYALVVKHIPHHKVHIDQKNNANIHEKDVEWREDHGVLIQNFHGYVAAYKGSNGYEVYNSAVTLSQAETWRLTHMLPEDLPRVNDAKLYAELHIKSALDVSYLAVPRLTQFDIMDRHAEIKIIDYSKMPENLPGHYVHTDYHYENIKDLKDPDRNRVSYDDFLKLQADSSNLRLPVLVPRAGQ